MPAARLISRLARTDSAARSDQPPKAEAKASSSAGSGTSTTVPDPGGPPSPTAGRRRKAPAQSLPAGSLSLFSRPEARATAPLPLPPPQQPSSQVFGFGYNGHGQRLCRQHGLCGRSALIVLDEPQLDEVSHSLGQPEALRAASSWPKPVPPCFRHRSARLRRHARARGAAASARARFDLAHFARMRKRPLGRD